MTAIQARSATPPIPGGTAGQRASGGWWIYLLLILGVLLMVGPFLWMLLGSLKPQAEFLVTTPTFLPKAATTDNYQRLFGDSAPALVVILVLFGVVGLYAGWLLGLVVFSAVLGSEEGEETT